MRPGRVRLQPLLVACELGPGEVDALAAPENEVFGASGGGSQEREQERKGADTPTRWKNQKPRQAAHFVPNDGVRSRGQAHGAASRSANCSIARAKPFA